MGATPKFTASLTGRSARLVGAFIVLVVGLIGLCGSADAASDKGCKVSAPNAVAGPAPANLATIGNADSPLGFQFGTSRNPKTQHTDLGVTGSLVPGAILNVAVSDLTRGNGPVLDSDAVHASATVSQNGKSIRMTVCIDPKGGASTADAGKYSGSLSIDDPRATGGAVPLTAALRFSNWAVVALATLVAALGGLVWTMLVTIKGFNAGGGALRVSAAAVATVLLAIPVYINQYAADPSWSGVSTDFLALMIAVGAAVIAGFPSLNALINGTSGMTAAGNKPGQTP
jgi:hypothetical protein